MNILKSSNYLVQISEKNVLIELTIDDVKQSLRKYFIEKENNVLIIRN